MAGLPAGSGERSLLQLWPAGSGTQSKMDIDMNLINFIRRNNFLLTLFPSGFTDPVFLGQINLDVQGRLSINIHTQQKPELEVGKWGVWGTDYDVIVINIKGTGCKDINIANWKSVSYEKLTILDLDGKRYIHQKGYDWEVKLEFDDFIFQDCSTYIDGGNNPAL
ncbi:immunity 50 family protein [Serratia quinivorans]|jgi:hypothetical protein|uniref:immunity 50 family protein n=2 Tax=Serratia quinivorans TaxID=137545 RepID=UPI0021B83A53|nr:immunity 50 family protein [Serratia quinivorans]